MTWHLDQTTAHDYVCQTTDGVASASIEAHLVSCPDCQALVGSTADPELDALLAEAWERVDELVDRPRTGTIERALLASGCTHTTARIVAASAQARWSYLAAVVMSVAIAISAAQSGRDAVFGVFLLLAPIGPLIATAGAFGRWADPIHELLRSVPTSAWRIALIRTATSVIPAILLTLVAVPILDERGWLAIAWLLPALALSVSTLVLATWISIEPATLVVGAAWLVTPMLFRPEAIELIDSIAGPLQIAALAVVIVGVAVLAVRRTAFEYRVLA
jgi:hypothetical protein